jgi:hypothetical protein
VKPEFLEKMIIAQPDGIVQEEKTKAFCGFFMILGYERI